MQRCGQLPYPAAAPPNRAVGEEETGNTESGALPIEEGQHLQVAEAAEAEAEIEERPLTETYQATGVSAFTDRLGIQMISVDSFKLIGQGTGNNLLLSTNAQDTINPDGTVTAFFDHFSVTCM